MSCSPIVMQDASYVEGAVGTTLGLLCQVIAVHVSSNLLIRENTLTLNTGAPRGDIWEGKSTVNSVKPPFPD